MPSITYRTEIAWVPFGSPLGDNDAFIPSITYRTEIAWVPFGSPLGDNDPFIPSITYRTEIAWVPFGSPLGDNDPFIPSISQQYLQESFGRPICSMDTLFFICKTHAKKHWKLNMWTPWFSKNDKFRSLILKSWHIHCSRGRYLCKQRLLLGHWF